VRVPSIKLHEAGHGVLPHQKKAYSLIQECQEYLDPDITDLFEREANVFAAEVLFQGKVFADEAHQSAFGMKVPLALAKKYGASKLFSFPKICIDQSPCVLSAGPGAVVLGEGKEFTAEVRR